MNKICYLLLVISILSSGCKNNSGTGDRKNDLENTGAGLIDKKYMLIAHRGGVTDRGQFQENSYRALDEAIRRGYVGTEIDVRQSKDGKLFLYHDNSFSRYFDSEGKGAEMTWEEICSLRPLKEDIELPVLVEDYCKYSVGKLSELMIDIKVKNPSLEFYQELERILIETDFLKSSYFIGHGDYFRGRDGARITMLMREKDEFFAEYGEKTKEYYFLFAGVDEINSKTIQWCKENGIHVMACVNLPYRKPIPPDNISNAGKDIEWLKSWDIISYQIDSDYDLFFREDQ